MKRDLGEALRQILVSKADWWLLGFSWDCNYYLERYFPFGLWTAPFILDLFANGLNWILMDAGWQTIHYLDDFLAILKGGPNIDADKYELFFYYVCNQLSLSINIKKNACRTLEEVLGIELDTVRMEAHLTPDKLFKVKE